MVKTKKITEQDKKQGRRNRRTREDSIIKILTKRLTEQDKRIELFESRIKILERELAQRHKFCSETYWQTETNQLSINAATESLSRDINSVEGEVRRLNTRINANRQSILRVEENVEKIIDRPDN